MAVCALLFQPLLCSVFPYDVLLWDRLQCCLRLQRLLPAGVISDTVRTTFRPPSLSSPTPPSSSPSRLFYCCNSYMSAVVGTLLCRAAQTYSAVEVASRYFRAGADKISLGSDAVYAAEVRHFFISWKFTGNLLFFSCRSGHFLCQPFFLAYFCSSYIGTILGRLGEFLVLHPHM